MSVISRQLARCVAVSIFFLLFTGQSPTQQTPGTQTATKQSSPATSAQSGPKTGGMPSAAEIASAKASGKVWVNLDSRIYHKGGRWYGKTKDGKFMTEPEAKAAGYRKSKRN